VVQRRKKNGLSDNGRRPRNIRRSQRNLRIMQWHSREGQAVEFEILVVKQGTPAVEKRTAKDVTCR